MRSLKLNVNFLIFQNRLQQQNTWKFDFQVFCLKLSKNETAGKWISAEFFDKVATEALSNQIQAILAQLVEQPLRKG